MLCYQIHGFAEAYRKTHIPDLSSLMDQMERRDCCREGAPNDGNQAKDKGERSTIVAHIDRRCRESFSDDRPHDSVGADACGMRLLYHGEVQVTLGFVSMQGVLIL